MHLIQKHVGVKLMLFSYVLEGSVKIVENISKLTGEDLHAAACCWCILCLFFKFSSMKFFVKAWGLCNVVTILTLSLVTSQGC